MDLHRALALPTSVRCWLVLVAGTWRHSSPSLAEVGHAKVQVERVGLYASASRYVPPPLPRQYGVPVAEA
jgi:hypothetical protein